MDAPERSRCDERGQFRIAELQQASRQSSIYGLFPTPIADLKVVDDDCSGNSPVDGSGVKGRHPALADPDDTDAFRIHIRSTAEVVNGRQHVLHVKSRHRATDGVPQPVQDHPAVLVVRGLAVRMILEPFDRLRYIHNCPAANQFGQPFRRGDIFAEARETFGPAFGITAHDHERMPTVVVGRKEQAACGQARKHRDGDPFDATIV